MRAMSSSIGLCVALCALRRSVWRRPTAPVIDSGVISGLGARNIGSAAMSGRISALAGYNDPSGKVDAVRRRGERRGVEVDRRRHDLQAGLR